MMSIGFMLPNPDDAVIWRGPRKNGLIKQFLKDVNWGQLDFLVVDAPPGTSDEHISVAQARRRGWGGGAWGASGTRAALVGGSKHCVPAGALLARVVHACTWRFGRVSWCARVGWKESRCYGPAASPAGACVALSAAWPPGSTPPTVAALPSCSCSRAQTWPAPWW